MTRDQMRRSEVKSEAKHLGRRTDSQYNKYNFKREHSLRMDFTDVGIRHTILNSVQLHHFIDISPSAAVIAKEARLCVIAIVVGWVTTSVVSSICNRKCDRDSNNSKR